MKSFTSAVIAFGAVASVAAQSSTSSDEGVTATPSGPVIMVTFPAGGVDDQTIVGSIVGISSGTTTVVIACPEGEDSSDCGLANGITIESGSSTIRVDVPDGSSQFPITEDCTLSGTGGICTVTGADALIGPGTDSSIITTTVTLDPTDIQSFPVTITAGDTAGLSGAQSTASATDSSSASSTSAGSSASSTASRSGGSTSSASAARTSGTSASASHSGSSSSTTSHPNNGRMLAPGSFGAAMLGLAAIYF